jgi:hypothetical protein
VKDKSQAPTPKSQINSKGKNSNFKPGGRGFGKLDFRIYLEFGAWDLEFILSR